MFLVDSSRKDFPSNLVTSIQQAAVFHVFAYLLFPFIVPGNIPWWQRLDRDTMLIIIAVIVGILICAIIVCIIIILLCRRKRASNKCKCDFAFNIWNFFAYVFNCVYLIYKRVFLTNEINLVLHTTDNSHVELEEREK